ncbi:MULTISPECIES: hypothetical protein [Roseateles]|jgi:hypothetical protein|uniref:Uncharacterized protein n=1 Tax=Pelomonas aquatica TaxID=431058 RepID=A0ABU1Z6L3_9BURK|nr:MULTISPECIES: hypothetical protein [Roseateles]KQY86474.1 hypothetical protein ASD35_20030 [Pelomonas sp. Root1444]MDR7295651.1 hypothetical protein [Pelomonas aquatica]
MQTDPSTADLDGAIAPMPLLAAAELQDHLMTVTNDLERLQRLLDDAGETLSTHFYSASNQAMSLLSGTDGSPVSQGLQQIMQDIAGAITALQFHDMATQLIAHTSQRLRNCADQLARDTFGADDEDGAAVVEIAPLRPNPVTQDEMDAGSIELF